MTAFEQDRYATAGRRERVSRSRCVSRPDYYGNPAGVTSDIDVVQAIYAAFAARDLEGAIGCSPTTASCTSAAPRR